MHCLYKTNFNFVYDDDFYNIYLEYLIKKSELKQNVLIQEIDIPSSTFTRVKRKGYASNKVVRKALEDYFKIKTVSTEIIKNLQDKLNTVLTYAYYSETQNEKELFDETLKFNEQTKNSPIRLLYWSLLSIAYNPVLAKSDEAMQILDNEVDFIEYMVNHLPIESEYVVTYALYEYALHKDDYKLAVKYTKRLEELLPQIPESLQSLGNFICMSAAILERDHSKALKFINRSLELQNTFFAPKIFIAVKYHLFSLYSILNDYEKMADLGEREILYLQFATKDQAFYYCFLIGLVQAYIALERYAEAEEIFNTLDKYDLDNSNISPGQVKVFKIKKDFLNINRLFMYYKQKNELKFDEVAKICEQSNLGQNLNLKDYVAVIRYFKKRNINSLKNANKMLMELGKNLNTLTSQIHYILTNELKSIYTK